MSKNISDDALGGLIRLTTSIINLAIDTTDERTQHLTDHIYHIITFSAITLCRLLSAYEDQLSVSHDVASLDTLVTSLVDWLKSIGLRSHVAHMLGGVVLSQQRKLRPEAQPTPYSTTSATSLPFDTALLYPEFINAEMFDIHFDEDWQAWE